MTLLEETILNQGPMETMWKVKKYIHTTQGYKSVYLYQILYIYIILCLALVMLVKEGYRL